MIVAQTLTVQDADGPGMDRSAQLGDRLGDTAVAKTAWTGTLEDDRGEGEGGSPSAWFKIRCF
jgi:hypothetical protein